METGRDGETETKRGKTKFNKNIMSMEEGNIAAESQDMNRVTQQKERER